MPKRRTCPDCGASISEISSRCYPCAQLFSRASHERREHALKVCLCGRRAVKGTVWFCRHCRPRLDPVQRMWIQLRYIERDLFGPPGNIRSQLDRNLPWILQI
jgi:hypothetical protein